MTLSAGTLALVAVLCAACTAGASGTTGHTSSAKSRGAASTTSPVGGSSALSCPPGTGTGSPGVTASTIDVGAISTLSGELASDFAALVPGMEAYFDMVDAQGGVDGRQIKLAYKLDDNGVPSQFSSLASTVINQDHAFAVAASTFFFNPTIFVSTCTPTYGYNVTGDWAGAPNLFAAGGSVQYYPPIASQAGYLMHKVKATSAAVLAYNVPSSADACAAAVNGLKREGFDVSYSDLKLPPINADITPDVQRIRAAHSDFIMTCMDVTGNIALARAVQQYGLHVHMLWLNGADQSVLDHYSSLMQGVYFDIQHVPFTASQKKYPGLKEYVTAMQKYEPSDTYNELAIQGWQSAALLVAGIRAAGSKLTQANVVKATNQLTAFTADGLSVPTNWTTAHTSAKGPYCDAYVQVKGKKLVSVYGYKGNVFVCFGVGGRKAINPVPLPPGTPGT
jgi:ABC-type branched-subunit amino acid transport system substrate-binding protein